MDYRYKKDFPNGLKDVLLPREQFSPLPKYEDVAVWERIPDSTRAFILKSAEQILTEPVPHPTATEYMSYFRNGNRGYEDAVVYPYQKALFFLTIAECVERKDRFLDKLIDHIWSMCELTAWYIPAHNWQGLEGGWHNDSVRPLPDIKDSQVDTITGTYGEYLAIVLYMMRGKLDAVSFLISERIEYELNRRVIEPFCNRRDAWWVDDSTHNWHMWITSNCLMTILLTETNPAKRAKAVELALRYTEDFYRKFISDGSNNEGPNYWGHSACAMYYSLKTLKLASNGAINHFDEPMVQKIGSFLCRVHLNGQEFYNYSFSPRFLHHEHGYEIFDFGREIDDHAMMELGAYLYHQNKVPAVIGFCSHGYFMLSELLYSSEMDTFPPKAPYVGYYYSDKQQLMIARENPGKVDGLLLGAKGINGHFDSHRDGASFILRNDGKPVFIDIGPPSYSREVIDRRYRNYHVTCIPQSHNSITVNGFGQRPGVLEGSMSEEKLHRSDIAQISSHSISSDDGVRASLTVEIGHLFDAESGVLLCDRTFTMDRSTGVVTIHQKVECDWESDICLHFITCEMPLLEGGIFVGGTKLIYDTNLFTASTEELDICDDPSTRKNWGEHIYRTTLTARATTLDSTFTITKE